MSSTGSPCGPSGATYGVAIYQDGRKPYHILYTGKSFLNGSCAHVSSPGSDGHRKRNSHHSRDSANGPPVILQLVTLARDSAVITVLQNSWPHNTGKYCTKHQCSYPQTPFIHQRTCLREPPPPPPIRTSFPEMFTFI